MKEVFPQYENQVDFYAIGTDPSEDITDLVTYKEDQGHPWPVALAGQGMLADFRVISQSTKIAFDGEGVITYRDGYSGGGVDVWREVFEQLAQR